MIGRFDIEKIQCCLCLGAGKDKKNRTRNELSYEDNQGVPQNDRP